MEIDTRPVLDLSAEDQQELSDLEVRCFGPLEQHELILVLAPADDTKYVVRVGEDRLLVSCLWITERTILVDGRRTHVAGIRGVRTDLEYRRRGLAGAAMRRATAFIREEM